MKHTFICTLAIAVTAGLVGCEKIQEGAKNASSSGLLQELGDKAKQATQKASEAASDAADSVTKSADKAWKETERKAGNITSHNKNKLERAANE